MTKIARHYSHTITITKSSHYCHNKQQYYNHENIQYNVKHLIVMQYACYRIRAVEIIVIRVEK